MTTQVEALNLVDFTGGLNLRDDQFQLDQNQSPSMSNVEVDPAGGLSTRRGFARWNGTAATHTGAWGVENGFIHPLSTGLFAVYMATPSGQLLRSMGDGAFSAVAGAAGAASPHKFSFAAWGDDLHVATGRSTQSIRLADGGGVAATLLDPAGAWNDDYTVPVDGFMPRAEVTTTHSGYLFVANTQEESLTFPNRIRWSHPNRPGDWAESDYIDILEGGSRIAALVSFRDHLLIFKDSSIWALYGYDADTWQLLQVSDSIGTPAETAVVGSTLAVFFYGDIGVFAYAGGEVQNIGARIYPAIREVTDHALVHVGWFRERLWVVLPWRDGVATSDNSTAFVFDPRVGGDGAWMQFDPAEGYVGGLIRGNRPGDDRALFALMGGASFVAEAERVDGAYDSVFTNTGSPVPGVPFAAHYRTPWLYQGYPERKKSWRRSTVIMREADAPTAVAVTSYRDYNESDSRRTFTVETGSKLGARFTDDGAPEDGGFLWGDGTLYGQASQGSSIERGSSLGLAKAIQLELRSTEKYPGVGWGVDAMILKYVQRRLR